VRELAPARLAAPQGKNNHAVSPGNFSSPNGLRCPSRIMRQGKAGGSKVPQSTPGAGMFSLDRQFAISYTYCVCVSACGMRGESRPGQGRWWVCPASRAGWRDTPPASALNWGLTHQVPCFSGT